MSDPKTTKEVHVALNESQLNSLRTSRLSVALGIMSVCIAFYALFVSKQQEAESQRQTGIYEQQLVETRHQIELTDQQNKKQNQASDVQSAKNEDQDRREFRAYIGSNQVGGKYNSELKLLVLIYGVKNFGKSKGKGIDLFSHYKVVPKGDGGMYNLENDNPSTIKIEVDLYTDQTRDYTDNFTLTDADVQKLKLDDFILLYYGTVFYYDIFDRMHMTHFCYQIDGDTIIENDKPNNDIPSNAITCNNHNSGD